MSVDVLSYFKQLLPVFENDKSVYCISAWNDQVLTINRCFNTWPVGFGICYLRWAGANKRKPQTTHREFRPPSVVIFSLRKDDDDEDVIKCTLLTEKIISGHPKGAFILAHFLAVL